MVDFQIGNGRRNHGSASKMIDLQKGNGRRNRVSASKMVDFRIGNERQRRSIFSLESWGAGPCRVGSPIHFFDLIRNNAPAQARAKKNATLRVERAFQK